MTPTSTISNPESYDVTILGGGMAGLCLARHLALKLPHTRVLVLEKQPHPVPEAAFKVGESSVEVGSFYLEHVLELETHLKTEQLPKFGLRFFFNRPEHEHIAEGLEMGVTERFPNPSYHLDRGRLENFLGRTMAEMGVNFQTECKVTEISLAQNGSPHQVGYHRDGRTTRVTTKWVVDASGRVGLLRRKLNLHEDIPHQVNAVWFRIGAPLRIDDWLPKPTLGPDSEANRSRWLSTIHLMGPGYWVWLIPLSSDCTSVGIVADAALHPLSSMNRFERALAWLQRHQPQAAARVTQHQHLLKDFLAIKHFAHGCRQVFSEDRWALTGEAGVFQDPFYSPGSDFIAMANSFIVALIERDFSRRPIAAQATIYDQLYRSFFQNTLPVYQDQYALFGNPRVMPVKVLWDYAVYWSFLAFIFIQQRMTRLETYTGIRDVLEAIGALNISMQAFFREWARRGHEPISEVFFDQGSIELLHELNLGLGAPLDDRGFRQQLRQNRDTLFALSQEIIGEASSRFPELARGASRNTETGDRRYFRKVFDLIHG